MIRACIIPFDESERDSAELERLAASYPGRCRGYTKSSQNSDSFSLRVTDISEVIPLDSGSLCQRQRKKHEDSPFNPLIEVGKCSILL